MHINFVFIDTIVFYISAIINWFLFLKLAIDWPKIQSEWESVENHMKFYKISDNLMKIIKKITIIFMSLALIEHLLFLSVYFRAFKLNQSLSENLQIFFHNYYNDWFDIVEYALWKGILLQLVNFQRTFIWTFHDVFIILLSIALSFRLKQFSNRIKYLTMSKIQDTFTWKTVREDYTKIYDLNQLLNDKLSWLIFHSFLTNLYFILIQLFSTLKPIDDPVTQAYLYISFILLILRVMCVCLYCGEVYEMAQSLVAILNRIPTHFYNIEIERLENFIKSMDLAFCVRDYFKITKSLIIKVCYN